MMQPSELCGVVDVALAVQAHEVVRDSAFVLQMALSERLPWMAHDGRCAIHPMKVVSGRTALALLPARARLLVRVPRERAADVIALQGMTLPLGASELRVGSAQVRELLGHGTLYAYRVAAQDRDESAFMAFVAHELGSMGIAGERVCGLHQQIRAGDALQHAFSLMVHGLDAAQSLHLQQAGLGAQRLLGCGVFVPHKSAAAV